MNSEATGFEILDQFRETSNKLKKRFLRKLNVTKACESFNSLSQVCENSELPEYAGMCLISAARCEGSVGNLQEETSCLTRAAKHFLLAEQTDHKFGLSLGENYEAALGCYTYSTSRYPEYCPFPIDNNLEMVSFLTKTGRIADVEEHLLNTIEQCDENIDTKTYCLQLLAAHYILIRSYVKALNTFTEIASTLQDLPLHGARSEVLFKCEINRVFLLLILKPAPQRLTPNLAKLLEKYTWGDQNDISFKACAMSEEIIILLQSVVAACQSMDTTNLTNLESQLWTFLEKEERDLLQILVKTYDRR